MFQFADLPLPGLFDSTWSDWALPQPGFPIRTSLGSKLARSSPRHFVACHVLHRLLAPRHPPRALCSLTSLSNSPKWLQLRTDGSGMHRTSSLFYGRNRRFETRSTDHVFTCKGAARCGASGGATRSGWPSSGPLVGDLEPRLEPTDQGNSSGDTRSTARGASSRHETARKSCEVCGVYPIFSSVVRIRCSRKYLMCVRRCGRGSGGDEETRTPDPLLAKEMLFQLSYVPLPLETECRWWAFLDSNQRPLPYQGSALTS